MSRAYWGVFALWLLACRPAPVTTAAAESESEPSSLVLIHTSDLHSHLFPERQQISASDAARGLGVQGSVSEVGGFARIAAIVNDVRSGAERSLYLDSGDVLEGTAVYSEFHGEPELRALSELGVAAVALGNHDLDPSAAELAERQRRFATFPVLSSNLISHGELSEVLSPSLVVEAGGLRVGLIGVANPHSPSGLERRDNPWELELSPSASAVQRALDALPPVDLVVVLSHLGLAGDEALIRDTSGIDVVLGGHQHIVTEGALERTDRAGRVVRLVHSGALGRYVGELDLELSPAQGEAGREVEGARFTILPVNAEQAEDSAFVALLEPYRERLEAIGYGKPLAFALAKVERNAVNGGDSALGNWVTDALRRETGADVALLNATGIRADLPPGELSRESLVAALPFDDPLTVLTLTGGELRQLLNQQARIASERECRTPIQVSGMSLELKCSGSASSATVRVAGRELDPRLRYRLVTTRYLADGGSGFELLRDLPRSELELAPVEALLRALPLVPACAASALPCLDPSALRDGRITSQRL